MTPLPSAGLAPARFVHDAPAAQAPAPAVPGAADEVPGLHSAMRTGRLGVLVLVLGLAALLAWAAMAPLDEGVPAPATVMVDTKRKPVQHLSGGIVKAVLVHEGDTVREGQPLIELDASAARANFEAVRQHYLGLRAMQGRLLAEQNGWDAIRFHPDLVAAGDDPQVQAQRMAQQQLFDARRLALQADLQGIEQNILGSRGSLQAYAGMLDGRNAQLALLNDELSHTRGLVAEGYAPRNRQLELERMVADARSGIAELQGDMVRTRRAIGELQQRALQRRSTYRQETASQLTEVLREVQADELKFKAAREELGRMEIRSPASGQVVGLAVQAVGAVIQPAQKLMDIVPQGEPLMLESRVPPHLIDRVHAGLPVDVRFSSFAHSPHLVVEGRVDTVSADLLTDPQTNTAYYLARVAVTPAGREALGTRVMQPGMPCEVVFRTGERSLLTYLLHPLLQRMAGAMKEE